MIYTEYVSMRYIYVYISDYQKYMYVFYGIFVTISMLC